MLFRAIHCTYMYIYLHTKAIQEKFTFHSFFPNPNREQWTHDVRSNTIFVLTKEFIWKATRRKKNIKFEYICICMWSDLWCRTMGVDRHIHNTYLTRINGIHWQGLNRREKKHEENLFSECCPSCDFKG